MQSELLARKSPLLIVCQEIVRSHPHCDLAQKIRSIYKQSGTVRAALGLRNLEHSG